MRRIPAADRVAWIERKEKTKGDIRLLGDHRDGQGKRFLDFKAGVTLMRNTELEDWPLAGPRGCHGVPHRREGRGHRHDELSFETGVSHLESPIFRQPHTSTRSFVT